MRFDCVVVTSSFLNDDLSCERRANDLAIQRRVAHFSVERFDRRFSANFELVEKTLKCESYAPFVYSIAAARDHCLGGKETCYNRQ